MIKKIFYVLFLISVVVLCVTAWDIWENNRDVPEVSRADIEQHYERAVRWASQNYSAIKDDHNPILWWMLKQAGEGTDNDNLKQLFDRYKKDYLDIMPSNLSTPMFDKFFKPNVPDIAALSSLYDYQVFFFYGLSCDSDLASEPIIQRQMEPGFCSLHYLHPRCITHQVMGLRFMQRFNCGYDDRVDTTLSELQKDIISELTWDFRVGDAYIQRVLMLVDSGSRKDVKPVWITRILDAQNEDGSWDDLYPIIPLGNDYVLAHTSLLPKMQKPEADFHATAQAIWLLSMLLNGAEYN